MSMLPQEVHAALSQLLGALASPDNNVRSQAEEQLNNDWVANRPDVLLVGLAEQLSGADSSEARSFSAILFRRIAMKQIKTTSETEMTELFFTLLPEQRVVIRQKLLEALTKETVAAVRNKVGDAVAEIATQYTDHGEPWPELLGILFQLSQTPDASVRKSAFRIFSTTPDIIEKQHEDVAMNVFRKGFQDEAVQVRIAAMRAFASFFRSVGKKTQAKYFGLVPDLLNILPPLKSLEEEDELSQAFLTLIELAELSPKMFKSSFNSLVKFSISVVSDHELGDQVRQNALELMATFCDYAPSMCKKDPVYVQEMVTQCLSLMTDVGQDDEDASEWSASEDLDLEESDTNHVAGEQCMDRLANKLGGDTLLPVAFHWIPRMLESTQWRDRHAALMVISAISEGCRDMMIGSLEQVLGLVVPTLRDPHPRVRFAGCNALGQMSTDFATTMQEKYHAIVLGNIIPVLSSPEPRVQAHAAAALVNFCEEAEGAVLQPYLEGLLNHLMLLLHSPKRFVQEQALSTIATVADSAEAAFSQFYDMLMPLLFNVLHGDQSKEGRVLRAKAMECATLIAMAVGKERMGQDALTLVQVLGQIQQSITDADDPQSSYLLHCWGRMCRILGPDFIPYLPAVMPPLLEVASARADVQILEDEDRAGNLEQEGWELVPLKDKVVGIRTSGLEDKNVAIELITVYAQVLEAAFEPYVLQTLEKIALPGLVFFFHDPVRVSSAKLIPPLLNSYKKAHGEQSQQFKELWATTSVKVIEVLNAEPAIDTLAEMFQCFYEAVDVVGTDCLTMEQMNKFIDAVKLCLEDYQVRLKRRQEEKAENDGEDEDLEYLYEEEDDQTLLSDTNKAFHTIFKHKGVAFLPAWERLLPLYDVFITSTDATQRQWATCIMDDVLEFCGPQSWNYRDHIIQPLIKGMLDQDAACRQAAAYGVGVAAQFGGPAWSEFVAASIPTLFQIPQMPESRSEENVFATENACASIAKVLFFNPSKVQNIQQIAGEWVHTLPIVNDSEAAPYAYSFLAGLISEQHPAVVSNAPKIFTDIVQALEAETLQGQTAIRVANAAKQLAMGAGVNAEQVLAAVKPEKQMAVKSFFQN